MSPNKHDQLKVRDPMCMSSYKPNVLYSIEIMEEGRTKEKNMTVVNHGDLHGHSGRLYLLSY